MSTNTTRGRREFALIAVLAVFLFLVSCATKDLPSGETGGATPCGTSTPVTSLAIVVGAHQNMPKPTSDLIACQVRAAITAGAPIAVITLDGKPRFTMKPTAFDITPASADNEPATDDDIEAGVVTVTTIVANTAGKSYGSDVISALDLAATVGSGSDPRIILVDNGLPDTGALRMSDPGMTAADPDEVVATLAAAKALPNFNKAEVELVGLGWTAAPQEPLTGEQRSNVLNIMTAIVTASNGTPVVINTALTGAGPEGQFTVTTVEPRKQPVFEPPSVACRK